VDADRQKAVLQRQQQQAREEAVPRPSPSPEPSPGPIPDPEQAAGPLTPARADVVGTTGTGSSPAGKSAVSLGRGGGACLLNEQVLGTTDV